LPKIKNSMKPERTSLRERAFGSEVSGVRSIVGEAKVRQYTHERNY
jgi:hypothetical protein